MESDDTMWFIPKNQRRDSWVKDRVKDRNTTHANFRVRFCNSCRKAHEKSIENNKKIIAIMANGFPITLLVASSKIKIPIVPIINSIGILIFSPKVMFKRTPPLSISWS